MIANGNRGGRGEIHRLRSLLVFYYGVDVCSSSTRVGTAAPDCPGERKFAKV